jgi:hypothetical protein
VNFYWRREHSEMSEAYESWVKVRDALINLFEKAFRNLIDNIIEKWSNIKELAKQYGERISIPKQVFPKQLAIPMKSQVINRKPMMVRVRSYC